MDKNSSYYKIFRFAMIIFVSVIIISGFMTTSIGSEVYKKSQLNQLKNTGDFFISCLKEIYSETGEIKSSDTEKIRNKLNTELNVSFFLYDENGICIIPGAYDIEVSMLLTETLKASIDNDDFLDLSSDNYSNKKPYLLYGSYFYLKNEEAGVRKVYSLVYGRTDDIEAFNLITMLIYGLFSAIGILSAFLLLKRRITANTKYESEFLRISRQYSKGDFSERINTDTSGNIKDIAEYVNALAAAVETSEETSKTFIANVSHELRTPITTIGGFVQGILDGTIKKTRQQEYLILVSNEIKRLRILITSMLNMTKFESGTMTPNFKETNLTDLVIQVALMFEKRIEEKNLSVEELDSSRLLAVVDADLMQQVIYNLIENAVKFVNEGGTLSFRFDKEDDICIIGIRNTGEGLKDSEIQQVFDRFYKADSSRGKDSTGLGLGLSISKKIVNLHNGNIIVKSVYGEYTEFQVRIPQDPRIDTETKNNKSI